MPAEGVPLSPPDRLLTTPEIVQLSELFVKQGVNKIRLTGGEPTVRKDILPLMHKIGSLRSIGLKELCLTTNGISLHRKLDAMVEAGLTGVNLSLDTLDSYQFQIMTRRKGFDAVMKSLERMLEMNRLGAGIKLKINAVIMRGVNEREIVSFVEMGRDNDIEVRFIEYMPFDGNKWSQKKMLPYKEMVEIIRHKYPGLSKVQEAGKNETSKTWQVPGFKGRVGFITSMTENFCGTCNRLRITADGNLKVCLFGNSEVNLRDLLRKEIGGESIDWAALEATKQIETDRGEGSAKVTGSLDYREREKRLLEIIGMAVKRKKERHAGMGQLENIKNRPMILIADKNLQLLKEQTSALPATAPNTYQNSPSHVSRQRWRSFGSTLVSSSFLVSGKGIQTPYALKASFHFRAQRSREDGASEERLQPLPNFESGDKPEVTRRSGIRRVFSSGASTDGLERDRLFHLNARSEAHQISVGHKTRRKRAAVAIGCVRFSNAKLLGIIKKHASEKGDVLAVARVAGIMAIKNASGLIPLAHNNVGVEGCSVILSLVGPEEEAAGRLRGMQQPTGPCGGLRISVACESTGKTGVEMEAMCGVMGAALTVVDMCKGVDKGITIGGVKTIGKKGGESGSWGIFAREKKESSAERVVGQMKAEVEGTRKGASSSSIMRRDGSDS
ncbi:MAG: hypothetical protein Q9166_004773 [cf. Caloplaca sp. 2 TL-2023]